MDKGLSGRAMQVLRSVAQQLPGAGPCKDCIDIDCKDCGGCECVLSEIVAQAEAVLAELSDGHT